MMLSHAAGPAPKLCSLRWAMTSLFLRPRSHAKQIRPRLELQLRLDQNTPSTPLLIEQEEMC